MGKNNRRKSRHNKGQSNSYKRQSKREQEAQKRRERMQKVKLLTLFDDDEEDEIAQADSTSQIPAIIENDDVEPVQVVLCEGEEDPFDKFMELISKDATAQIGLVGQKVKNQVRTDIDNIEEDTYHELFVEALKPTQEQAPQAPTNKAEKPVIMAEDDDTSIWELLRQDNEQEVRYKRKHEKRNFVLTQMPSTEVFKKELYIPSAELKALTQEQVQEKRKSLGNIQVRGKRCPAPVTLWSQCGLDDRVLRILERKKFPVPFPVQAQAIPAIMSGRDVIGIAETGSGKTLAYLLPLLRHVLDQRPVIDGEGPIALIMAPTRELANQIYNEARRFTRRLELRITVVYGGSDVSYQLQALRRGVEIVVCTPGRMIEVLWLSNGKITNLRRATFLVIDEADRMFDLGFEPQIQKIVGATRTDRQTVMFSATFPNHVETLAKRILWKPIEIIWGGRNITCANVQQFIEIVDPSDKLQRLQDILEDWLGKGQVLIFVEKQQHADDLFKELAREGFEALVLHGAHDQADRDFAIEDFRTGVKQLLIATSLAARGLDIKDLVLVINYIWPSHLEDYIHRIGRTGRAGNSGTAITFVTKKEQHLAYELIKLLDASGQEVPVELQELALEYKILIDEGKAKRYKSRGFGGKGYKFNQAETEQVTNARDQRKKDYDFSASDTDEEDYTQQKRPKFDESIGGYLRNPKIKAASMSAAQTAAKAAIISGNPENALQAANEAIELIVMKMKSEQTFVTEKDNQETRVAAVRDKWIAKDPESKLDRSSLEIDPFELQQITYK